MSHESEPLISIIVAVYNSKATLQQCIDSVTHQTYPNRELIIIDGGSNDGTVELLEDNRNKLSYWVSEPDNGIYNAWNKGLAHAKGEWICFLGADDYFWDNTVLGRMVPQLARLPGNIRVAYGQVMMVGNDGEIIRAYDKSWEQAKVPFRAGSNIPTVGLMYRKSLFEYRGLFDDSFRIAGDYELLLRELMTGDAVFISNVITAGMRKGGISTTKTNHKLVRREVYRALRMHGQHFPERHFIKIIVILYIKRYLRWLRIKILGRWMVNKISGLCRRL